MNIFEKHKQIERLKKSGLLPAETKSRPQLTNRETKQESTKPVAEEITVTFGDYAFRIEKKPQ